LIDCWARLIYRDFLLFRDFGVLTIFRHAAVAAGSTRSNLIA